MAKPFLVSLALILLMAFVVACGSAEEPATEAPAPPTATTAPPTAAPTAAPTPTEAAMEEEEAMEEEDGDAMMSDADADLVAVADELAGGPGSIYIGDGNFGRLVGPAPGVSEKTDEDTGETVLDDPLGDGNGMVPLAFVEKNRHIFETDYYKSLIEKAKLTDPTPLTSSGESHKIQYACINRALLPCVLQTVYFAENVKARTNGQVDFEVSSYPELGLAGSDMIELVQSGTIEFAQIQPAYVGGTWPLIDIIYVWGLWKDFKSEHEANTALLPSLDAGVEEETQGGKLIYHIWYGGNDQYFFSNRGAELEDFDGLKTRSHGTTMTDAINGLGGRGSVHGIRRRVHGPGARHPGRRRNGSPRGPRPALVRGDRKPDRTLHLHAHGIRDHEPGHLGPHPGGLAGDSHRRGRQDGAGESPPGRRLE